MLQSQSTTTAPETDLRERTERDLKKALDDVTAFIAEDIRRIGSKASFDLLEDTATRFLEAVSFQDWPEASVRELLSVIVKLAPATTLENLRTVARSESDWATQYRAECEAPGGAWHRGAA